MTVTTKQSPLTDRRRRTRERIMIAARDAFATRGVAASTVEEICEAAGFTRGAFYSNFEDKEDLVLAFLHWQGDLLQEAVERALRGPEAPDTLEALIEQFFRMRPPDRTFPLVYSELLLYSVRRPDSGAGFVELTRRLRERSQSIVLEGLRRIGRESVVDPADLIDALHAVFDMSQREALLRGSDDLYGLARRTLPGVVTGLTRPVTD